MPVALVGVALSLYGSYEQRRAAQKNQRSQSQALDYAKTAREDAVKELGNTKMFSTAEHFFPGLMAPSTGMVRKEQAARAAGQNAKNPGQLKNAQNKENKIQQQLNPWDFLKSSGYGGTPTASAAMGAPLSTPMTTTAPTHGGVDPTQLPTDVEAAAQPAAQPGVQPGVQDMPGVPGSGGANATAAPAAQGYGDDTTQTTTGKPLHGRAKKKANKQAANAEYMAQNPFQAPETTGRENQVYPGQLVMQHLMDQLQNPGRLESTTYERAQEQANQGLNAMVAQSMGRLTGLGVDPRSGIGQSVMQSGTLNFAKERNEAARDYSIAQEDLRRRDIQQGMDDYTNFLSTIFGMQKAKSAAKAGGPEQAYGSTTPGATAEVTGNIATQIGGSLVKYGTRPKEEKIPPGGGANIIGGAAGPEAPRTP